MSAMESTPQSYSKSLGHLTHSFNDDQPNAFHDGFEEVLEDEKEDYDES